MGGLLLFVFIVVPILEIVVFIQAGKWIGLWPTMAGIVMSALIGVALVRHQGFAVLKKAQQSLGEGRFPVAEVFDGLCIVIAGALLLTPGFITDMAGFLLLIPWIRTFLRRIIGNRMMASGRVEVWADAPLPRRPSSPSGDRDGVIIDADYEHVPEEPAREQPDERQASGERPQEGNDRRAASPWRKGDAPKTNGRR